MTETKPSLNWEEKIPCITVTASDQRNNCEILYANLISWSQEGGQIG